VDKQPNEALAWVCGTSRTSLYHKHKQPDKDWKLKCDIEAVLGLIDNMVGLFGGFSFQYLNNNLLSSFGI
jgi:hypothetical protein